MGIKGLSKLLGDAAPACRRENKFENYFGRQIAVDASMHIYQFLVVVGRSGDQQLTDQSGEVTSHLQGMFYRTVRMLESGMKPIYVFDGAPPEAKREELSRRAEVRGDAAADLAEAKETGADEEAVAKLAKRTVKVTKQHNEECKKLLRLLGVPVVDAPSEAEAQCASLVKQGAAFAMASEDMDSLTFGAPRVLRKLMAPASQKLPVEEYDYAKMIDELKLTHDQFVDLCILCGCDYAGTIRGIGPKTALSLIRQHGSIEKVLENIDRAKHPVPEPFPFEQARKLFKEPTVATLDQLPPIKFSKPDVEGVVQFLVREKDFDEARIRGSLARLGAAGAKAQQGRLDSFFKPVARPADTEPVRKLGVAKRPGGGGGGAAGGAGGSAPKKMKGKAGGIGRK